MTFPTETISTAGSGLTFVNTYDASVSAAYRGAIISAETYLESHFTNAVSIHASFTLAALSSDLVAQNSFSIVKVSYDALKGALAAHATTADDQLAVESLPAADPSNGVGFQLAVPEAVILGLSQPYGGQEVAVTLNSTLAWTYGQDAVGAIEHELSEGGFGRISSLGLDAVRWEPLDLFRFTAAGVRDYAGGLDGVTTYFGVDGSHVTGFAYHNGMDTYGNPNSGDVGDWAYTNGDAFGPGGPGAGGSISATDLRVLDVLGWTPAATAGGGESLAAGPASPTLMGGAGADTLVGYAGSDYLRGGDGNDSITGGTGFNDINGNKGDDTIVGHSTIGDWLVGGQGNDSITTTTGYNILYGNLGNDTLHGGTGHDILRGGQGDDSIVAGSGPEWISGDRGDDTIQGGSGADTFHSSAGVGMDLVIGFDATKGDHVQLDPGTQYSVHQSGADVVVDMGNGDQVVLQGVTLSNLPQGWLFEA